MKAILVSIIVALVIFFSFACGSGDSSDGVIVGNRSVSNEVTAKKLGYLFYILNPINEMQDFESIKRFVTDNSELLQDNSPTIRLARKLGDRLVNHGIRSFSNADYDQAYSTCVSMGANAGQARQASENLQQGAADAVIMGNELLWIADVVPRAANGDWTKYRGTGSQSRQYVRQLWPVYKQFGLNDIVRNVMSQFQPYIQEQVVMLALMFSS